MSAEGKINLVLYWHMHQPEYRNLRTGEYYLPWTYLHAIKDYVDMAAHLERYPAARAVVNFVPTLLEQIDDYSQQIANFRHKGTALSDPLLDALVQPVLHTQVERRRQLIQQCLRANEERLINRYAEYARLASMGRWLDTHPESITYLSDQYLADLMVWFHLAWLGETVRREDARVARLIKKGRGYSLDDRNLLLQIIGELLSGIIPRYRRLAEAGVIELSMTPYAHPIMPLLLDIHCAREALPHLPLPLLAHYPDGANRLRWQIEKGMEIFEYYFGQRPRGCWPSEGGISDPLPQLLGEYGIQWLASGDTVLRNSLVKQNTMEGHPHQRCLHTCYQKGGEGPVLLFRDDGISDLIGFSYANWHADDAVADLLRHVENIASACSECGDAIISVILDGENAWETYPENGYYFLDALYQTLSTHPRINLTTYSDYLATKPQPRPIDSIVAGSWVYGTFSTWIGEAEKNRAWDILGDAKQSYDQVLASGRLDAAQREVVDRQLAICEGSDWFWWFGDYNPSESVRDFDYLYRLHLSNLYRFLGLSQPDYLSDTISRGGGASATGGVMRQGKEQ
ncbi:MAG: glycoside hydrolase family 57 protein [Gammaproteobacteria bacterium]|nr:glycoside hydrolase family 57 protein [Gammaproteobacteria bacterium]